MRISLRILLILLSSWLTQFWLQTDSPTFTPPPTGFSSTTNLAVLTHLGIALIFCFFGTFGRGFFLLLLGMGGGAIMGYLSHTTQPWVQFVHLPGYQALLVFYALLISYVILLVAPRPSFKSGELTIRDGGDHLSVGKRSGEMTVFRHGHVLCIQGEETRSETRFGGGTYTVPTTGTVVTYGPNGTGYGTVYGSQTVSTPVFSYETSVRTGKLKYTLEEVGLDHALLIAKRPKHVFINGRHGLHYREKSAVFTLGYWAAFRFNLWRKFHAKLFFRKDEALPRRIYKAASGHFSQMKERFGKPSTHEFTLDHELGLVSFVGLAKDKIFVYLPRSQTALTISKQDANRYWQHGAIRIPETGELINPSGKIRVAISEWAQVATLRQGKS